MEFDFDLFVIGAGSGGVRAARMAAASGAKVAVAEDRDLGGTCVNVGCVPKKLFVYASHFPQYFRASAGFGWSHGELAFDWSKLRDNKTAEIRRLNGIYGNLLDSAGVTLLAGRATIAGPHRVRVGDREYSARYILVAVGGWPHVPQFPGSEHVVSSNEMFFLQQLPKRIVIVGGGYIAVEFAGIMNGLGVETHLVYRRELFLRGFDEEIRVALKEAMLHRGVKLHFNSNVNEIVKQPDNDLLVRLDSGDEITAQQVMYATGRVPKTQGLGLENTGVQLAKNGAVVVDDYFATAEPSIYALGDVIDRVQLTPVAITEAMALVQTLFYDNPTTVDYSDIPTAIFSQPEIGTVGLSEEDAWAEYGDIRVYHSKFKPMIETLGGGDERILMKLIVDAATDRVVGCHMLGDHAAEIIQGIGIAFKAGATKKHFDQTIGIHPSAAEEFVTMRNATR